MIMMVMNNMSKEIWKDIKGFEGQYQVSNLGRVKSLERTVEYERFGRLVKETVNEIILSQFKDPLQKRYIVFLYKNGVKYARRVHRLVAEAFVPNPENLKSVIHKDGNLINNEASNLLWSSSRESCKKVDDNMPVLLDDATKQKCEDILDDLRDSIFKK